MDTSGKSSNLECDAEQSTQDWLFDAFSEPRTMPTGWDLSAMNGSRKPASDSGPVPAAADPAAESTEHYDHRAGLHIMYLNPFPEPRTYPVYWDLCR
jgi:hypothetical protein